MLGLTSNLIRRIISSVVLIGLAGLFIKSGGVPFSMAMFVVAILITLELNNLLKEDHFSLLSFLYYEFFTIILFLYIYKIDNYILPMIIIAIIINCILIIKKKKKMSLSLLAFPAIVIPCLALEWLRLDSKNGLNMTIWLVLTVCATDIGGYFTGRIIGGAKLAPRISPGKTWSGLLGGMIFAAIIGFYMGSSLEQDRVLFYTIFSVILAVIAQMGDLCESYMKRRLGVKDSGYLIPGHGGIMDRLDGFFLTTPLLAFFHFMTWV